MGEGFGAGALAARTDVVIFDFDGTLLDTGEGIAESLRAVFDMYGAVLDERDIGRFIGPPLFVQLKKYCGFDDAKTLEMVADYRGIYMERGVHGWRHYAGVTGLLRRLRLAGKRLYVATNKPKHIALIMLEESGLLPFFEGVYGAELADTSPRKAMHIREIAGGGAAIMVGDRKGDVFAAHEADIPCIYVGYGYGSREEAAACGADAYCDDVLALARLLGVHGLFISFEGGEGTGKTTQAALAEEYLKALGKPYLRTFEPGGCPISLKIRELLLDNSNSDMKPLTEALLYAAARAQHVAQIIRPALADGKIVLCDRYIDSSIAYQGFGRGLGAEAVLAINGEAMGGIMPHRTYCFLAEPQLLLARQKSSPDRMEAESRGFKARVEKGFEHIAESDPGRVVKIDATCPRGDIFDIIKRDMETLLI